MIARELIKKLKVGDVVEFDNGVRGLVINGFDIDKSSLGKLFKTELQGIKQAVEALKPFIKLSEDVKDFDREWADKILDNVPIKCPVYQCGGLMVTKERPYPKGKNEDDFPDGMDGDTQTPDLVCSNCGAIYSFQRFKNARR